MSKKVSGAQSSYGSSQNASGSSGWSIRKEKNSVDQSMLFQKKVRDKNGKTVIERSPQQEKFDNFQNGIHNQGMHPRDAAQSIGSQNGSQYKKIKKLHQIRLDQGARVSFSVNEEKKEVVVKKVGKHPTNYDEYSKK